MPYLDRAGFIGLLNSLGAENETEVLAAAREIQRRLEAAETAWPDLLTPPPEDGEESGAGGGGFEIRDPGREPRPALPGLPPLSERLTVIYAEELNLIESLLRRSNLSPETRQELTAMRADIAEDDFADMDRTYLRDLAARLNARDRED